MSGSGEQQSSSGGFTRTVSKKALAPVVTSAATAATAYGIRKGIELWHEKVVPKLEERGGGRAVAGEALEAVGAKLSPVSEKLAPVSEKLGSVTDKIGGDDSGEGSSTASASSSDDAGREQERKQREERRAKRRKSLEQAGAS